jgi:hypothetical protein
LSRFSRPAVTALVAFLSLSLFAFIVPAGVASAAPIGAPLIEYTRFPGGNWGSYNVSGSWSLPTALINAVPFVDPLTRYQNEYATSTGNHLIEYTRLPTGKWIASDITAAANGPAVTNDPAPFVDPLTGLQNVYSTSTVGHLIQYTRQPLGGWMSVDLTQSFSGPAMTGDPAPFVDPLTGLQNVYVTTPNGHIVEYTREATRWVTIDLTATFTGPSIFNDPAPFTDPLTGFQNVYGTSTGSDLVEYTRMPAGNWITVDITGFYGGPNVVDHPAPFTDPLTGLQNVYATTTDNHLSEYTRKADGSWISIDLTSAFQGAPVPSSPAPFVDPGTGAQIAFSTTNSSHLVEYERQPQGNWRIIDITASYSAAAVPGDPKPFIDPLTLFLNVYVTGIS